MPIEIKELHIRVAVKVPQGGQASQEKKAPAAGSGITDGAKEAIVAECVEQVMQILQGKSER
jgi:hypothetical protein